MGGGGGISGGGGAPSVGPNLQEPSPFAPWIGNTGGGKGGQPLPQPGIQPGVQPGSIPGTLNPAQLPGGYIPPVLDPMSVLTRGSPASGFIKTSYSPNQYGDSLGYGGYTPTTTSTGAMAARGGGGGGGFGGPSVPGNAEGSFLTQPRFDSNTAAIRKAIGNPNYNPRTDVFTEEERARLRNDPAANAAAEEIYLHLSLIHI